MDKSKEMRETVGLVLVHGAGLNGGIWRKVEERMNVPCLMADFPLRSGSDEARGKLALDDYASHIREQISAWDVPRFVLAAHSIGGLIALKAVAGLSDRLAGFAGVGAAIPEQGGSYLSILPLPQQTMLKTMMETMGTKPPEAVIRNGLCNDLKPEEADDIVQRFAPESIRIYTDLAHAAVPAVPKLYVRLKQDRSFDEALQLHMIANLSPQHVEELDTGHLPMLSDPDGLSQILHRFISELG